ncbi:MAG: hypothetical protein H8E29_14010 [Anaerolineales bacterium]|uniref:TfoX C-terminal domain-containing protein n=1 Tax=Candidatus Desulfolinea nitratireducens TaxID=2841698 RepID=A0A8J6TJ82_9CHLR|nr:hypothetical protein [Candidatus Desulfolinea nitratireducens]
MFVLNVLSESAEGPDLTWLLWLVLGLFALIVIIGWIASIKGDKSVQSASSASDDLKKLEGIGPKVEKILNNAGVTTYAGLAAMGAKKIDEILDAANLQMMDSAGWIEQAVLANKGDWDALDTLIDELKGGRRA